MPSSALSTWEVDRATAPSGTLPLLPCPCIQMSLELLVGKKPRVGVGRVKGRISLLNSPGSQNEGAELSAFHLKERKERCPHGNKQAR